MTTTTAGLQILRIPRTELCPGPWQPRTVFDQERLEELATSLKVEGVLTPLRVIASPDGGPYLIIAGERRWRASALAGLDDLPCILVNGKLDDGRLHELALLDNLHRADLRPGEEARAVAKLERLGLSQRQIGDQLGKSQPWVSYRLAIARLPDIAIEQLDSGAITREEARTLAKLASYPDVITAILEPDGKRLKARLGGHVPHGVGERLHAVRRVLEIERRRDEWAAGMRADGHRVLDERPGDDSRRYVRLPQGSELSCVHQEAGLVCEVWAWEYGQGVRYCDDRTALNLALAEARNIDSGELSRREEQRRVLERESARDEVIRAWLATASRLEAAELATLSRERIRTLTVSDDRLLARLGTWLGISGDRATRVAAAERELSGAGERRLAQLWFLLEIAHGTSYSPVPEWLVPWLTSIGFDDPHRSRRTTTDGLGGTDG